VIEYAIFLQGLAQQCRSRERNEIWHNGSLGNKDDVRTSNTRIAQSKRTIPQLTVKNNRNIVQCCRNTHQGAPPANKRALALRTSMTVVTLFVILLHTMVWDRSRILP